MTVVLLLHPKINCMSSIWAQRSKHLRWIVRWIGPLRKTGSDVTGSDVSHVSGSDMSHMSGSMFCACAIGSYFVVHSPTSG